MTRPLTGQKALITGGSRGIGRAIAEAFADAGADVAIVHYRDGAKADEALGVLKAKGVKAEAYDADVADEAAVVAMVGSAATALGRIDILVNNAGINIEGPLVETTAADFDRVIAVNLRGPFLVGREAIRHMVRQGRGGRVINTASELGYLGRARASAYCASKGGLIAMTRAWAREFAPAILVNAIAPGPIDTDLLDWNGMTAEERAAEAALPLGRIGRPAEVAAVALFLAGPGATYVTGQCYGVNGGAVMT